MVEICWGGGSNWVERRCNIRGYGTVVGSCVFEGGASDIIFVWREKRAVMSPLPWG